MEKWDDDELGPAEIFWGGDGGQRGKGCTSCEATGVGLLALDEEGKGKRRDEGRDRTCSLSTKIAHHLKYMP